MEKRGFLLTVKFIIAEVGNNHLGSMKSAKQHIREAKESGASAVKLQAFDHKDIKGSMPQEFYEQCALSVEQYLELIEYGSVMCSIPVFYSVFSKGFEPLLNRQMFFKLSAGQVQNKNQPYGYVDEGPMFLSFNKHTEFFPVKRSQILYATDYMPKKLDIDHIGKMKQYFNRPVGLSDHHEGIDACLIASSKYDIHVIEKHFTLKKNITFKGLVFRDSVHGSTPKQFARMVGRLK